MKAAISVWFRATVKQLGVLERPGVVLLVLVRKQLLATSGSRNLGTLTRRARERPRSAFRVLGQFGYSQPRFSIPACGMMDA